MPDKEKASLHDIISDIMQHYDKETLHTVVIKYAVELDDEDRESLICFGCPECAERLDTDMTLAKNREPETKH